MRSNKEQFKVDTTISPVAIGTTGTGQTGRVVDRKGYRGVSFVAAYGAITATAAVFTAVVREGDATGTMTSVADADLIGVEADLGLPAAVRTDFVGDRIFRKVSYKGLKRYVSASIKSTATAGTLISCAAILIDPDQSPVA
jgi:hypothetical protein